MRIGFVDHNLDNYHTNVFLAACRGPLKARGFEVSACFGEVAGPSAAWAEKNQVPFVDDAEAMDALVDVYMVLAPSDPATHLPLCQRVLPFGKPTYVDKTFAPDAATARRLFALADRHRAPVQTSSALRYTAVQDYADKIGRKTIRHMVAWGGGRTFNEYAIHPLELVVSCMGPKVQRLMRRGDGKFAQLLLDFSGGRSAVVNVYCDGATGFAASVTGAKGTEHVPVDGSTLFVRALSSIMDFFARGRPVVARAESLAIARLLEVAKSPRCRRGFVRV